MARNRPEDALQRTVCDFLAVHERMGKLRYAAVPNGGKRSRIEAAIMNGLGTRAGFPDLIVMIPSREYEGVRAPKSNPKVLFLELKAPKGKLSDSQKGWQMFLQDGGFQWHEIRTFEAVESLIRYHLGTRAAA